MNSINFYHLNKTNTYFALAKLLEKAFVKKKNALVRTNSNKITEEIDETLWSYDRSSFVPHSKPGDKHNTLSPIYITDEKNNPNNAIYLFIINTSNFSISEISEFQRTFILFNNEDKEFIDIARKLWIDIKRFDIERKYWVETKEGWKLNNHI